MNATMPRAPDSDEPRYGIDVRRDVRIPTPDPTVTLSADVYRPLTNGPVPVLVTVVPYRKDYVAGSTYDGPARWFASRGYAGLVVDLLGTGASDGVRRPEFDPRDGDDAIAAIEWASSQHWCDGAVGMWGMSYAATTTLRAASLRPSRLRAVIAMLHGLDPARHSVHPDGARGDLHALANRGTSMLLQQLLPPLMDYSSPTARQRWERRLRDNEPVFLDYARHGPDDPVWRDRAIDGGAIVVPALCVGGWRDAFTDGLIDAYERVRGPKKLLVGPWGHLLPQDSAYAPVDFLRIGLRWWDHWLRGVDTGVMAEPPVTLHLGGSRPDWCGYDSWPPAHEVKLLATRGDTTLAGPMPSQSPGGRTVGHYSPDPTVGALRGLPGLGMGESCRPQDQHDDDLRSVCATSDPLTDGLIIGGRPVVTVVLGLETPCVPRLAVRLCEVDPRGRSFLVTAGVLRTRSHGTEHRVVLAPVFHRIQGGRRLRVAIGDADFPRLTPLAEPVAFGVAAVRLSVPLVPEGEGAAVDVPTLPEPDSVAPSANSTWTITRDLIHDATEVTVTSEVSHAVSGDGHRYRLRGELRAVVRRTAPERAVTTGTQSADVRMTTGESVTAVATVRCTQDALWARGELAVDGLVVFERTWDAELTREAAVPAERTRTPRPSCDNCLSRRRDVDDTGS